MDGYGNSCDEDDAEEDEDSMDFKMHMNDEKALNAVYFWEDQQWFEQLFGNYMWGVIFYNTI